MSNMRIAIDVLQRRLHQGRMLCGAAATQNPDCNKSVTYLQILHDECDREINLVNDLLDLQRLGAEHHPLEITTIELPDWIDDLTAPFHKRVQERQQTLQIKLSPDLPPLNSDPVILWRVLAELLNNACKYTPSSETITLTASCESGKIRFNVSNSGVEIPAQELPRIFDMFYRVPGADIWKQGGTGLGLAIAKKLVNCLGGSITVESAGGQTCFTVELPIKAELAVAPIV